MDFVAADMPAAHRMDVGDGGRRRAAHDANASTSGCREPLAQGYALPLFPESNSQPTKVRRVVEGHIRILALLFNHLVGEREQFWRGVQIQRLGGLEIKHQFKFGRSLNRQVSGIFTP